MRKQKTEEHHSDMVLRDQAYHEMGEPLQGVAKDIRTKFNVVRKGTLLAYHDIGERVDCVARDEVRYGSDGLALLTQYFGFSCGDRTLSDLRDFATEYSKEFLGTAAKKPMANGDCVSYSHFVVLMKIKVLKHRAEERRGQGSLGE